MKCNCFQEFEIRNLKFEILVVAICVLLLQIGFQEQTVAAGESKPESTAPEPAVGSVEAETAPEANEPAPKITFEKTVHDFGRIGPGTKNVCEFKFTNTGDSLLKVQKKVKTTCGCTVPTLSKEEYAPGESGTVKVRYSASKRAGAATRRLYVHSNDKANPKVQLTVKAKVVKKIDYEPERINLSLRDENGGCPEITLSSSDNQKFAIKEFKATGGCITADYDPAVKAKSFVLQPKVDVEKLQKYSSGSIKINLTQPGFDAIAIPFNVLQKFKSDPASLIVFKAEPQEPITKKVWILSNYGEDFEIESTSSEKDIIKVLSQEKVGNRYKFELEIIPPAVKGKQKTFNDEFVVNIKGGEKLTITCRGFYSKNHRNQQANKN